MRRIEEGTQAGSSEAVDSELPGSPGKRSQVDAHYAVQRRPAVQMKSDATTGLPESQVQDIADRGVARGGSEIPYRSQMEHGFGTSFADVRSHTGGAASAA